MARNGIIGRKIRGTRGKYLGRPRLCDKEPAKGSCLKQLHGPNSGLCRNCQAAEVLTKKIKVFGK